MSAGPIRWCAPASDTTSASCWTRSRIAPIRGGSRIPASPRRTPPPATMATLHLIYGPVGSGKTTFARKLERQIRAVRFTPDEWMLRLYGDRPPAATFQETLDRLYDLIWEHAERVVRTGTDVIMDCGFWT